MIIILNQYKEWIDNSLMYVALTKNKHNIFQIFYKRVSPNKIESKLELLYIYLKSIPNILFNYKKLKRTTYVMGLHFPFFFIARFFKCINENVVIDNFYLHKLGNNIRFQKLLTLLLKNKQYHLIVQSEIEVDYFRKISPTLKIDFIPYCMGKINVISHLSVPLNLPSRYVFTGGYTNRDYDLVLLTAKHFPNSNFVIVMSRLNIIKVEIPVNVFIYKDVDSKLFYLLLSKSECVIVPLKDQVGSSGQMLCLSAMQLGKPIIYSENSSINQYFAFNNGISYQLGNLNNLKDAISKYLALTYEEFKLIETIQIKTFNEYFTTEIRNQLIIGIIEKTNQLLNNRNRFLL